MDALRLADLQGWCSDYESTLRSSFGAERRLPEAWEAALSEVPPETLMGALRRYALLKHYYLLRQEEKDRPGTTPEEAQEAARQLLRREPVEVEIGGRTVYVTARSYACMAEIARHERRIRLLTLDRDHVEQRIRALALTPLEEAASARRKRRRDLARYVALATRLEEEILRQRGALWAHALTPDGAPARDLSSLPAWWREIDPMWDVALLVAAMEAGAGRYGRLGAPPERGQKGKRKEAREDFGWASLFATVERRHKLEPATLYDRDLYQLLAWMRAGAEPVTEELED